MRAGCQLLERARQLTPDLCISGPRPARHGRHAGGARATGRQPCAVLDPDRPQRRDRTMCSVSSSAPTTTSSSPSSRELVAPRTLHLCAATSASPAPTAPANAARRASLAGPSTPTAAFPPPTAARSCFPRRGRPPRHPAASPLTRSCRANSSSADATSIPSTTKHRRPYLAPAPQARRRLRRTPCLIKTGVAWGICCGAGGVV